jgi:hypothetical protein
MNSAETTQGFEGEPFKLKSIEHLSDVDLILPEEDVHLPLLLRQSNLTRL